MYFRYPYLLIIQRGKREKCTTHVEIQLKSYGKSTRATTDVCHTIAAHVNADISSSAKTDAFMHNRITLRLSKLYKKQYRDTHFIIHASVSLCERCQYN